MNLTPPSPEYLVGELAASRMLRARAPVTAASMDVDLVWPLAHCLVPHCDICWSVLVRHGSRRMSPHTAAVSGWFAVCCIAGGYRDRVCSEQRRDPAQDRGQGAFSRSHNVNCASSLAQVRTVIAEQGDGFIGKPLLVAALSPEQWVRQVSCCKGHLNVRAVQAKLERINEALAEEYSV